ncbi:hypothetical protein EDB83DRAFT_2537335 [Lactarius deliciosus]|nr:hypothetical protein EDB83DRAFT_2647244 [Lactarius deliciosus]KAH8979313.1 hypothetical protein EDB83DRAFT_2537335 [Lactarius deliciosus]
MFRNSVLATTVLKQVKNSVKNKVSKTPLVFNGMGPFVVSLVSRGLRAATQDTFTAYGIRHTLSRINSDLSLYQLDGLLQRPLALLSTSIQSGEGLVPTAQLVKGVARDVEKLADTQSSDLATSVLLATFESLDGDSDMEQFLSRIPGLYASAKVHLDGNAFARFNSDILPRSIMSFMDHVLSSNLPDSAKQNCVAICSRAINANLQLLQSTFRQILQTLNSDIFKRADFVRLALEHLRRDDLDPDPWVKDYAQCIVAVAMNRTPLEDGAWIDIAWHYLKPQHAQYRWEAHNLRLCNLIYLTRQLKDSRLENSDQFENGGDWYIALVEARKLEVRGTALGLRLEFRTLWNDLVVTAHDMQRSETARQNAHRILYLLSTVYTFM